LVSPIKVRAEIEVVGEPGAEENAWT